MTMATVSPMQSSDSGTVDWSYFGSTRPAARWRSSLGSCIPAGADCCAYEIVWSCRRLAGDLCRVRTYRRSPIPREEITRRHGVAVALIVIGAIGVALG